MKIWYSLFNKEPYKGNEPFFFNPNEFYFSEIITQNYDVIYEELKQYLAHKQLPGYFNSAMVTTKGTWKTVALRTWGIHLYENYKYFPKTLEVINSMPELVSASFNLLEPGGHIVPHCGDTNAIYRCHLGLRIPGKIPECGFRVGDEKRSWEEGKLLIFIDAHNHEAFNYTNENRFIFNFDIIRKDYIVEKKWVCATVLTSLFLQKRIEIFKVLSYIPDNIQLMGARMLVPFALIAVVFRNLLYRYRK